MPLRLGAGEDNYESLKLRRGAGVIGAGSDSVIIPPAGGVGLENKIYLWPSAGTPITTYDPTETGLLAALATQASGDTVWLPSIPISLTAAITLGAGAILRGMSYGSILSFSGFGTGAAIILSANSIIQDFTLDHPDGKWFDASADGCKAVRIHGTALRALGGISLSPTLSEIWVGATNGIWWRTVAGSWSAVASLPNADEIRWFRIANDGATLYCTTHPAGSDFNVQQKLYKCHNPKAGSPTWTLIAQAGDSAAGSTISTYFNFTLGPCVLDNNDLYMMAHLAIDAPAWAYGVYDSVSWSWLRTADALVFSPAGVGRERYGFNNLIRDDANSLVETITGGDGYEYYRSLSGVHYCTRRASSTLYTHQIGGADLATLGSSSNDSEVADTNISGPEHGNQVYVVSAANGAAGHLWLSDDGSTFSDVATWAQGWVKDVTFDGGGSLIWLPSTVTSGATMLRRYLRAGSVDADLTGNFWSVTTGNKVFSGLGLVYA
jgi:hypothetical protein